MKCHWQCCHLVRGCHRVSAAQVPGRGEARAVQARRLRPGARQDAGLQQVIRAAARQAAAHQARRQEDVQDRVATNGDQVHQAPEVPPELPPRPGHPPGDHTVRPQQRRLDSAPRPQQWRRPSGPGVLGLLQ